MKKSNKVYYIIGIVVVIILAVIGYLYFTGFFNRGPGRPGGPGQRNIQLSQTQIDDVTNFFSTSPSSSDIQTYCSQNRQNCFYYCRTINPQEPYCTQMMNFTRGGNRTRGNFTRGNYTRGNYPGQDYGGTPQ